MIGRLYVWMKHNLPVRLNQPLVIRAAVCFLLIYWAATIYIYLQIGLRAVAWHTHLIFPLSIGFAGWWIIKWIGPILGWEVKRAVDNWVYYIWLYFIIELIILTTGVAKVKNEDGRGHYLAYREAKTARYYHNWNVGSRHWLSTSEFRFERLTNSLGFPDREWEKTKQDGAFRILCLGDSFTEGDGAHVDSSYVAFLSRKMKHISPKIEVMNAGTCGSDPYFNYINLKDRLCHYHPDLIIQTVSSHDILHDLPLRGGMDRFRENGKLQYPPSPWWEPLYAVSYIFRIFIKASGYNPDLTRNDKIMAELSQNVADLVSMFNNQYARTASAIPAKILLLYLPLKGELEGSSDHSVRKLMNGQNFHPNIIYHDLLPMYQSQIALKREQVRNLYWKNDGHHNHKGYEMMAECIHSLALPLLPDSLKLVSE